MKRVDSTHYLYHWVKADPHMKIRDLDYENAYHTFLQILDFNYLKHGDTIKTGGERCICFTESPEYFMHRDKSKYQPFGFKYYKRDIFALGGRAVIYAPDYERPLIHESMMWRYMRHDPLAFSDRTPFGVDFTWEREWRLPEPELSIIDAISIIVPNHDYIQRVYKDTQIWLDNNARIMEQECDYPAPHPDYLEYIEIIRSKLITPEQFQ
ncbi:hypothetical protein LNM76_25290 [Klebsiella pneumoniae]|uniref:hypothetical protein n=1 Tax=Klebsiella pneumoniae complex TaxID=3390273 RepID=UPI0019C127AB|nr:hypothetical protein [Klebsiella pneumoniae]MBD7256281.1 hypothetical protein [Klebsiella pneumoniae]MBX4612618.1 hypothetical protein [Klebsiella pneumoniae]MCH0770967.1 hypothetical protein [Klebsiella pneumoniae]MDU3424395.1 hypothetical protein [Klebsiella pneumoniae]MDU3470181.1 hypothetical protein [Klebsiella pneumoniae]